MPFQLTPQIYALLLCASITQDQNSGGWFLQPFSHVAVQQLPTDLALTVFAQIMAPPGQYDLTLRLFHAAEPEKTEQVLPSRPFSVEEGKNLDFMLHIEARFTKLGLYIVEASIAGHHTAVTPLRLSTG